MYEEREKKELNVKPRQFKTDIHHFGEGIGRNSKLARL